jgi:hypothetical protein
VVKNKPGAATNLGAAARRAEAIRKAKSSSIDRALGYSWSMIFSENRCPLFGIML